MKKVLLLVSCMFFITGCVNNKQDELEAGQPIESYEENLSLLNIVSKANNYVIENSIMDKELTCKEIGITENDIRDYNVTLDDSSSCGFIIDSEGVITTITIGESKDYESVTENLQFKLK